MNPYHSSDLFVGRHNHLARLNAMLDRGRSVLLIGGRRVGKTTLLRRVEVGRTLIRTDTTGWDLHDESTALGALLGALKGGDHPAATRPDIRDALDDVRPLALVIDEADRLLQTRWGPGFFAYLRYLDDTYLRDDIAVLLAGGPVLASFKDPDDRGSPPLNTAETSHVQPLDRAAVAELAENADVDMVFDQAGGHAWLTVRLLAALWDGQDQEEALDTVFDHAVTTFHAWHRQLGEDGRDLLRELPMTRQALRASRWREAAVVGRCVGAVRYVDDVLQPGPRIFTEWLLGRPEDELAYDLAISYASEDTAIAHEIQKALKPHFKVFYAPDEQGALWGNDLHRVLPNVYGARSRYVLVLSTNSYVTKHWTRLEYDSVTANTPGRVLLVDFGTLPEDRPAGMVYRGSSPGQLVALIDALRAKLSEEVGQQPPHGVR
ncbi:hypothetical protein GCM10022243_65700 [Saccharothrix violaceirubra]|uniref:TIR domain-containing protein n=1 Tax=Saccharothrix violaceirubra TaxID=413306 RepID=A0A7W7WZK1_9PSEU|nr:AAA family ATPase [Saccharothrix violaceirubra]MBB4968943.1 hypothetical protein [Saccharothrix violaceirubra]